jgi:hypothetical protein
VKDIILQGPGQRPIDPPKRILTQHDRQEMVLDALHATHCAMSAGQIQEWVADHTDSTLKLAEIMGLLEHLTKTERVQHPGNANPTQWILRRKA